MTDTKQTEAEAAAAKAKAEAEAKAAADAAAIKEAEEKAPPKVKRNYVLAAEIDEPFTDTKVFRVAHGKHLLRAASGSEVRQTGDLLPMSYSQFSAFKDKLE